MQRARIDPRWNQQTYAVKEAHRRDLRSLTRQVLIRMERGQTKNPDPNVLKALASLYAVPFEEMFGRFIREKYGIDLLRHGVKTASGSQDAGGLDDAAAAQTRIDQLEQQLRDERHQHATAVRAMQDVARKLADAIAEHANIISTGDAGVGTRQPSTRKGAARARR